MSFQIYLASRSPRRRELLRQVGVSFELLPTDVAEVPRPGQSAADYVVATALAKARAGAASAITPRPVLGADTDVVVDGEILGQPGGRDDAIAMLLRLSNRTHEVYSGIAVVNGAREQTALSVTRVSFGPVTPDQAGAYWDSGEPAGKAGAYAIQGLGARLVSAIAGSYSGVVGLPLYETCELLAAFGIEVPPRPPGAGAKP